MTHRISVPHHRDQDAAELLRMELETAGNLFESNSNRGAKLLINTEEFRGRTDVAATVDVTTPAAQALYTFHSDGRATVWNRTSGLRAEVEGGWPEAARTFCTLLAIDAEVVHRPASRQGL